MQPCRVLFVDDDAFVLRSLRRTMQRAPNWTSEFETDPEEALGRIDRENFDIVVSDFSMPQMTGMDLLSRVQEVSPATVRVIMTGGHGAVTSNIVHQKWTKPWSGHELISSLDRIVALRRLLRNPKVQEYVGEVDKLPSPPEVVSELMEQLPDPDSTAHSLARTISSDPAISAKILQLCNSAFMGRQREIHSIQQGVVMLGKRAIGNLVLAEALYQCFDSGTLDLQAMRQKALTKAQIACEVFTESKARDDAFAAGLLADTGLLILSSTCPELLGELLTITQETGEQLNDVIRKRMGTCPAELGAYLLAIWGLPPPIIDGVLYQFTPKSAPGRELEAADSVYICHKLILEYQSMSRAVADLPHIVELNAQADVPRWQASTRRIMETGQPRGAFRHPVAWTADWRTESSTGNGMVMDASPFGLFFAPGEATLAPKVGTEIILVVRAAPPDALKLRGIVRWTGYSAQHDRTGLGVHIPEPSRDIEKILFSS